MESTLTIRLPSDLRKNLEEISVEQGRPVSELVRDSLKRYVAIERFRRLRRQVLPLAESRGLLTDEDVFAAIS